LLLSAGACTMAHPASAPAAIDQYLLPAQRSTANTPVFENTDEENIIDHNYSRDISGFLFSRVFSNNFNLILLSWV